MSVMDMWSLCDRCGFKYRRKELRAESTGVLVCRVCYDGKFDIKNHPQNYAPRIGPEPSIVPGGKPDQLNYLPLPLAVYDFRNGTVPANFILSRNSPAHFFNSNGVLTYVGPNIPRLEYSPNTLVYQGLRIESATTNEFTNPFALNAVAGTPGTLPTNWTGFSSGSGLSRQIIGTGIEDGIYYLEVRFFGTATANTQIHISSIWNIIPATIGQTWSVIGAWRLVNGTLTGLSSPDILILQYNNNTLASGMASPINFPTAAPLRTQIYSTTKTLNNASVNNVGMRLRMSASNGQTIDFTLRIALLSISQTTTVPSIIRAEVPQLGNSAIANEVATLYVPTSATMVEQLQQDADGYSWTTVPLIGNQLSVLPRMGQTHLLRFGAWPANLLTPVHKQAIAEQT